MPGGLALAARHFREYDGRIAYQTAFDFCHSRLLIQILALLLIVLSEPSVGGLIVAGYQSSTAPMEFKVSFTRNGVLVNSFESSC